jgi:hypothetical protein
MQGQRSAREVRDPHRSPLPGALSSKGSPVSRTEVLLRQGKILLESQHRATYTLPESLPIAEGAASRASDITATARPPGRDR